MTHDRHVCEHCSQRKARYQYRGVVRADRTHTLCFACFRSERDRQRARSLDNEPSSAAVLPLSPRPVLTAAQRAHRVRMLAHLRARATAATHGRWRGREWHCDA